MKLKLTSQNSQQARVGRTLGQACAGYCNKIKAQINRARAAILAESINVVNRQDHLLRLVLNEAEAQALQTGYPHLLFPSLAAEKVQVIMAWNKRQQSLRVIAPI